MGKLRQSARYFWSDETGQDLVEYVLLIVLFALAMAVFLLSIQGSLSSVFEDTAEKIDSENPGT